MPLNRSLVDADDSVDVLCALMLALPEAVRETFSADVLQNNGCCHIAPLHALRLDDLEEMDVLRGHARMIMSVLRPGGDPPHTPVASPRNETSIEAPRPAGRYVRCRSFPVTHAADYADPVSVPLLPVAPSHLLQHLLCLG